MNADVLVEAPGPRRAGGLQHLPEHLADASNRWSEEGNAANT